MQEQRIEALQIERYERMLGQTICFVNLSTNRRRMDSQRGCLVCGLAQIMQRQLSLVNSYKLSDLFLSVWTAKQNDYLCFREFSPDPKISRTQFFRDYYPSCIGDRKPRR